MISKIMSADVISVSTRDTIAHVAELFEQHGFHHMPVVDGDRHVVGVISSTDIDRLRTGGSLFKNPKKDEYDDALFHIKYVEEIMTPDAVMLASDQTMRDAYDIFRKNKFRCIPITNSGVLVGMVTQIDLLTYLMETADV